METLRSTLCLVGELSERPEPASPSLVPGELYAARDTGELFALAVLGKRRAWVRLGSALEDGAEARVKRGR